VVGRPDEKRPLEDLGVDGRILKVFPKSEMGKLTGLVWLMIWTAGRLL
jgi:hypothetical protein